MTIETAEPQPAGAAPERESAAVDVSILIVTWNSERWIGRCLESIPEACAGVRTEVVVADNASTDATLALIGGRGDVIRSDDNDGFAAGINRAFRRSRGRYVFLLNPDCELAPESVTRLARFLDQTGGAAAAAPLLEDDSGGSQREFQLRRLPTLASLAAEVLALNRLLPNADARHRYRDLDLSVPQRIEQPAAAALLIRRNVFEEVGPLDEQFAPAWFEDVDYCARLAAANKELWVVPSASARHFGGSSLEHLTFERFNEVWYGNMWRYARKWFGSGRAEALRWAIMASMLLRCGAAAAGLVPEGVSRRDAFHAYRAVLKKAWNRWDGSSRSSS